jgi:hypothetical protein
MPPLPPVMTGGLPGRSDQLAVVADHDVDVHPAFDRLKVPLAAQVARQSAARGLVEEQAVRAIGSHRASEFLKKIDNSPGNGALLQTC